MDHKAFLIEAHRAEKTAPTSGPFRPAFHLAPPTGWLNDPNGLCQWENTTHIFFQYNPLDLKPGNFNYWGHYTTEDFITYTLHQPALSCDTDADANGVYSGSAVVEEDQLRLYYTGNVKHPGNHDYTHTGREHNTMTVVSKDGIHFTHKEIVMTNADYPVDETLHVRDPKVFDFNGIPTMVLGARTNDDVGEVLLYQKIGDQWALKNRLRTKEPFGYMWECPDLFTLEGQTFLSVSPQGVDADGYHYQNIYQSGTFKISGDPTGDCSISDFTEYDQGFDFYAPQTYLDNQGRRILIAWMGLPDVPYDNPTTNEGWMHMLTIPRILSVNESGKMCQAPLTELKKLRQNKKNLRLHGQDVTWKGKAPCEIILSNVNPASHFSVTLGQDCKIIWDGTVIALCFGASGCGRKIRQAQLNTVYRLHLFIDHSSIECFVNDGSTVFTSRYYPQTEEAGITFSGMAIQANIWPLKNFNYSCCSDWNNVEDTISNDSNA